jgi:phospholipase/carboxylesterase
VILLHGFGANARDLVPLSAALDPLEPVDWYFPEAPLLLGRGPAGPSRAWFPKDPRELERAYTERYFTDLPALNPSGLRESVDAVVELISSLGVDPDRLIVGGFSQGAIVALWSAFRLARAPRGAILFSGSLVAEEESRRLARSRDPIPFVQTHGKSDPILPFQDAKRLYTMLSEAGHPGRFVEFTGAHQIPEVAITAAKTFVQGQLA